MLAAAGLGKDAGFFTGAAKAPQDDIKRLVLADFYTGQVSGNLSRPAVRRAANSSRLSGRSTRGKGRALYNLDVHICLLQPPMNDHKVGGGVYFAGESF